MHNFGLGLVDLPTAINRIAVCVALTNDNISVAQAPTRAALAHPAFKAAPRLVGEVLQEQCVHRALEPDMQLADLAFREGHEANTGKVQPFE